MSAECCGRELRTQTAALSPLPSPLSLLHFGLWLFLAEFIVVQLHGAPQVIKILSSSVWSKLDSEI